MVANVLCRSCKLLVQMQYPVVETTMLGYVWEHGSCQNCGEFLSRWLPKTRGWVWSAGGHGRERTFPNEPEDLI